MAPESIPIATCINTIFSSFADGPRHTILDQLEKEFIFFQEDLKDYTVDELHDKVKVPLHAAKILERFNLLKDPAAPTGSNLLTMHEYLQQTLRFQFAPFGAQPGPEDRERSLDHVGFWNILPQIAEFVDSQDNLHKKYPADERRILDDSYESTVQAEFRSVVRKVGSICISSDLRIISWRSSHSSQLSPLLDATDLVLSLASGRNVISDLVVSVRGRDILVIEMKKPAVFRASVEDACVDLGATFTELSSLDSPNPRCEALVEPVYQIYTYMTNMNLGYGILSSLDVMYLVRRVVEPRGDTLEISEAISCDSSRFLGAVAYVLDLAFNDQQDFNQLSEDAKRLAKKSPKANLDSKGPDHNDKGKAKVVGPNDMTLRPPRHRSLYGGLKETPAEHLNLEAHAFATGWSGNVVRGTYEGHAVAVKIAKIGSVRAKALLTEIRAYDQLRKYWGKYVPELVSYGTTAGGRVVYIATHFINGHEIGKGVLTTEEVEATFDALAAVHDSGLLHGDIRSPNFLVDKRVHQGVRLIDFGFSRPITSSEDRKRERAQLEFMLQHVQKPGKLTNRKGIASGLVC